MIRHPFASRLGALLLVVHVAWPLAAQCDTHWLPGQGLAGTDGTVRDMTLWDPDGAGPRGVQLVVVGTFARAGTVPARAIAAFDVTTATWDAVGPPLPAELSTVLTVAVLPNGHLVVGGSRTPFVPGPPGGLFEFDGTSWSLLGGGVDAGVIGTTLGLGSTAGVARLQVLQNGDLLVGGDFTLAGGIAANFVARWDGTTWHPYGSGLTTPVTAITELPNGDIVVGDRAPSFPWWPVITSIQRWDGSTWSTMVPTNDTVQALATLPNGDLIAGGDFDNPGLGIMRWNGVAWSDLGGGVSGAQPAVNGLRVLANGDLVATGLFTNAGNTPVANIARWDGISWSPLGNGIDTVGYAVVELPSGVLAAGGNIVDASGIATSNVALWDGTGWHAPGAGLDARVHTLHALADGAVVGGGEFQLAGDAIVQGIARWGGNAWSAIAGGISGGTVHTVVKLGNGDLVAAGDFTFAGGAPAQRVARCNGVAWSPLGSGLGGGSAPTGLATAVLGNGDVVVAGKFATAGGVAANAIARWTGSAWQPLGSGLQNITAAEATVYALAVLANGDLVAAGQFELAGGAPANGVARWNGASWSAMPGLVPGTGPIIVRALAVLPDGSLVAGGTMGSPLTSVMRWNGASWAPLGTVIGAVQSLLALPNGDVIAGGVLPPSTGLLRWHNGTWSPFAPGNPMQAVQALALTSDGRLAVAADFAPYGGVIEARFNVIAPTCPASVSVTGTGCSGAGGVNVLVPQTLPWLGATWRAQASGLAPAGIALVVRGVVPASLPIAAILPQGLPGCDLLVAPLTLDAALVTAGGVTTQLSIPATLALAQQSLHEQVVAFAFGSGGAITAITSTNALALTIGTM